jgi:hypothetical protein
VHSATFLSPGNEKKDYSQSRQDRGGSKARSRGFGAGMKTLLQPSGQADQEKQKSQTDKNQPDRFLVIGTHSHFCKQPDIMGRQNFKGTLSFNWKASFLGHGHKCLYNSFISFARN